MAEYRVIAPLRWRRAEDAAEVWDDRQGAWTRLAPSVGGMLAAIERGAPLAEVAAARGPPADERERRRREGRARRLVYNLSRLGYVDIPFPVPARFESGDRRYAVLRELGRGGVGIAWLCRDEESGATVVVKRAWDFLQPYAITEAAMRREADIMGRLDHPGIARLFSTFERDGHLHLVREYLEGEDLMAHRGDGLGHRTLEVAEGIAHAVGHLHARGFLLLDLRPSNFVLDARTGAPRLLDVGGCRALEADGVRLARSVGSAGFMSPEMRDHHRASVRSDVWGFGRLLSFLASGRLPRDDEGADALAARTPPPFAALVRRLCDERPEARPASMVEVVALLRAAPGPGAGNF